MCIFLSFTQKKTSEYGISDKIDYFCTIRHEWTIIATSSLCKTKNLQISFSDTTMIKITIRLDKRYRLNNGRYPVKLAVARNGKTLYVPLNIELDETDWDADSENHVRNRKDKRALNTILKGRLSHAELLLQELQLKGLLRRFSDKRLIAYLSSDKSGILDAKFSDVAEKVVELKDKAGTKESYETVIKAIARYCNYEELLVADIDEDWVKDFKDWAVKTDGLRPNTVETYVSKIKVIYNFARNHEMVTAPFPQTKSLRQPTKKRSLLIDQLRAFRELPLSCIQSKYRDVFFLIFYMRGINMTDLAELPADAIQNGRLQYIREKTGKFYDIKIEPEMMEIIEKYRGNKHLLRFFDGKDADYYKNFGNGMRQSLRNSAKKCGITEPISAYWARHSWSSVAIEIGTDIQYVSAGLGHSLGNQTTQIYIQYRQKQIDDISRRVIDYLLQKGEYER